MEGAVDIRYQTVNLGLQDLVDLYDQMSRAILEDRRATSGLRGTAGQMQRAVAAYRRTGWAFHHGVLLGLSVKLRQTIVKSDSGKRSAGGTVPGDCASSAYPGRSASSVRSSESHDLLRSEGLTIESDGFRRIPSE